MFEQKKTPRQIGVQFPIGAKLVVNMQTARALGINIPEEVLPFISKSIASAP